MPGTAQKKLDEFGIDAICERIAEGASTRQIGDSLGVAHGSVLAWLEADTGRSVRAREARTEAARHWDEQAEAAIKGAPRDSVEIQRARELAQHYRWRAKIYAPREYGDRIQVDARVEISDLTDDALDAKLAAALARIEEAK